MKPCSLFTHPCGKQYQFLPCWTSLPATWPLPTCSYVNPGHSGEPFKWYTSTHSARATHNKHCYFGVSRHKNFLGSLLISTYCLCEIILLGVLPQPGHNSCQQMAAGTHTQPSPWQVPSRTSILLHYTKSWRVKHLQVLCLDIQNLASKRRWRWQMHLVILYCEPTRRPFPHSTNFSH